MCGIYGTTLPYSKAQIVSKLKRTSFRGPDQLGYQVFENENGPSISLGHNRLSIVDLDPRSNQPFTYLETIHLVFNGEIFNFKILKSTLTEKGYHFNTTSDTEVICAAYLEYGQDCVYEFNGQFAFVLYDQKKNILFGARDRLGQKPFYYFHNSLEFEFASQISAIQIDNPRLTISKDSINSYLSWGSVPDPNSIFNEVKKLKAGYAFTLDLKTGNFDTKQYWDVDLEATKIYEGSYDAALAELEELITDAVRLRLYADVPVGIFLSGGIDSSLIAALATRATNEKVKTFSVKFNDKGFDESIYAERVAKHLRTDHHVIECDYHEGISLIENFSYNYDEPFSDASAIPSLLLSKYTRKHVTVALSGDAGDESFLGYHRYNWMRYVKKAYHMPDFLRMALSNTLSIAPYYKLKIIGRVLKEPNINDAYMTVIAGGRPNINQSTSNVLNVEELKYLYHTHKNIFERISDFDLKTYLNWDINTKVDRASMAYSLEVRSPLIDYRVVDFSRMLPTQFKYSMGNQKRILKDILYKHVPRDFFDRPKSGFTMPFKEWFRGELMELVLSELNDTSLQTLPCINPNEAKRKIKQHMNGSWNHYNYIWMLLVLKQWLKKNGLGYTIK